MGSRLLVSLVVVVSAGLAQYHESKYSFKGLFRPEKGNSIQVVEVKVANDEGAGAFYVTNLREIDSTSNLKRLPVASISEIDFVSMSADEEKLACTANGTAPDHITPCLYRKADVKPRDGKQMRGIYIRVHGFTAYGRDGKPIEFNDRQYKVFSLVREASN